MLYVVMLQTQYMDISGKLNGFGDTDPIEIHWWQQTIVNSII